MVAPAKYSTGQYHLHVPRERSANLRFRQFVLRRCREDTRFRRAVVKMCGEDILFFINVFVWQFNPSPVDQKFLAGASALSVEIGPFITFEFQEVAILEIIRAMEDRSDLIIEKSREMGASWLCLMVMLWFFLFHPNKKFLCVSRNQEAVDDREDSDSLFWKIDFILRHLPEWIAEVGPKRIISRKVLSFNNRANGSQITGQATTGKIGVGGRCFAMFLDEFSQIDEAWEVLARTSDTTGCRIFNGTHKGTATAFYELCQRADAEPDIIRKIVMHWSMHPDKRRGLYRYDSATQRTEYLDKDYKYLASFVPVTDGSPSGGPFPGLRSPWYDWASRRKGTSRDVAADLDINPSGTVRQVFDPLLIQSLKHKFAKEPERYDLGYDRLTATPTQLFKTTGGEFKLWQRLSADGKPPPGRYVFSCDVAQGTGATSSCLTGASAETGEKVLEYDSPNIEPKEFAYLAVALCRLYVDADGRPARLAWETPGPGNIFGKHVIALGHHDVYYRTTDHRLKKEVSDTPGWTNSPDTMLSLIINYRDALREQQFLNRSEYALSECLAFMFGPDNYVYHTGWKDPKDPSAARINHGDHVVADALAWKLIEEMGRLVEVSKDTREEIVPEANQVGGLAWRRQIVKLRGQSSESWA